ncbi:MAG TPA: hypothetical protein VMV91_06370 [Rhodocyclaceae bacterium]|nr:hypothetical protein [Rhodocyclaceae bacterium]
MSLDLLFVVSTDRGARVLAPLAAACGRAGKVWGCFFTNDGVKLLADDALKKLMPGAGRAVACEHSWQRFMGESPCPVELGSQTDHSALVAEAASVVAI